MKCLQGMSVTLQKDDVRGGALDDSLVYSLMLFAESRSKAVLASKTKSCQSLFRSG